MKSAKQGPSFKPLWNLLIAFSAWAVHVWLNTSINVNRCSKSQSSSKHKAHKCRKVYICIAQVTRVHYGTNRQHVRTLRAVAHLHHCCSDHCHNTTRSYPVPHDCIAVVTAVLIEKLKEKCVVAVALLVLSEMSTHTVTYTYEKKGSMLQQLQLLLLYHCAATARCMCIRVAAWSVNSSR
jgi:hypothetical protein